jgi:hypothetical protein
MTGRASGGRPRRVLPLVLLGALLLAGCDGDGSVAGGTGGLEVTDSAGVTVVRDASDEVVLSVREALVVGVAEGDPELQFHRVRDVAPDPEGGFWVADAHEAIRRFDAEGRYVRSVGGRGEGPGEAQAFLSLRAIPGRVLATGSPPRILLFGSDGAFLGSRSAVPDDGGFDLPLGWSGEEWVFMTERASLPGGGDHRTAPSGPLPLIRASVELMRSADPTARGERVGTFVGRILTARGAAGPRVLGNPSFAVDGSGNLFVSDSLRYRIEVYGMDGSLRRVVERPVPSTSLPDPDDFEAEVRAEVERTFREGIPGVIPTGMAESVMADQVEQITSAATAAPLPPHLPFIDDVLAAPDGTLWVRRADRHPRPAARAVAHSFGYVPWAWAEPWKAGPVLDILDPDGAYRGTVELPRDYVPMAVDGDRVYGSLFDELGVERVVVYEVGSGV